MTLLLGTLSFSFMTMRFVGSASSPDLSVSLAALGATLSLLLFVVYLDRFLHRLRPVAVAAYVAREGRGAFEHWMRITRGPDALVHPRGSGLPPAPPSLVIRAAAAGVIQSVDVRGLATYARRQHCLIIFHHPIGDFVPRDAELCSVYGDQVPALAAERLGSMVALGVERTIEQDPLFAMRIMVDIADKALSPAVNDPTTAVQVLDHLAETLRLMGTARLEDGTASADLPDAGVLMPLRRWRRSSRSGSPRSASTELPTSRWSGACARSCWSWTRSCRPSDDRPCAMRCAGSTRPSNESGAPPRTSTWRVWPMLRASAVQHAIGWLRRPSIPTDHDVLGLLGGHLLHVQGHAHDVGGLLGGGLLDESSAANSVSTTSSAAASSMAMAVATTSAASAMAASSMNSGLGQRPGDLEGGGHLDLLGRLDGLLGLELDAQLLAHHGQRIGRIMACIRLCPPASAMASRRSAAQWCSMTRMAAALLAGMASPSSPSRSTERPASRSATAPDPGMTGHSRLA